MALLPNHRAKGIADSDDEDPNGERAHAPAVEEEEEGSDEVLPTGGGVESAPEVGITTAATTASVEVEGGVGVHSSTTGVPPATMDEVLLVLGEVEDKGLLIFLPRGLP